MDAVAIRDLKFRWSPGEPLVLDIPELTVASDEQVFLAGPSGSGKTSLLNLLGGIAVPEAGALSVLDQAMSDLGGAARDAFRADHIGFVFQMFNLVPYLSVRENVHLACMFSAGRRARADADGGIDAAADALLVMLGLAPDRFAERRVAHLSIGQQQRVALARALIGRPRLVIADEPTSALDGANRDNFLELLTTACRETGAALILVSHDPAIGERLDRRLDMAEINAVPLHKADAP